MKNARSTFNILYNKIIKGHSFIHKTCFFFKSALDAISKQIKKEKKAIGTRKYKRKVSIFEATQEGR